MLRQRRLPQARADSLDIWLYVAADSLIAADRLVDRFDDAVSMLTRHHDAGRQRPDLGPDIRSFPVESYAIFYRVTDQELIVLRILSGFRDQSEDLFDES